MESFQLMDRTFFVIMVLRMRRLSSSVQIILSSLTFMGTPRSECRINHPPNITWTSNVHDHCRSCIELTLESIGEWKMIRVNSSSMAGLTITGPIMSKRLKRRVHLFLIKDSLSIISKIGALRLFPSKA